MSSVVFIRFELDVPVFERIMEVLSVDDQFYLSVQLFTTDVFNSHYHAYEVRISNVTEVCQIKSLPRLSPSLGLSVL